MWSGLPPAQTRLTWQLCWALGAHGQAQALPCQVTMHRVHPAVPGPVSEAVDTSGGEEVEASASATAAARGAGGGSRAQRSLLILVSACHMVLAVVLTAYDEDIEELAGGCGGLEAYVFPFHIPHCLECSYFSACSKACSNLFQYPPRFVHGGGTFFTTDTSFASALNRCD